METVVYMFKAYVQSITNMQQTKFKSIHSSKICSIALQRDPRDIFLKRTKLVCSLKNGINPLLCVLQKGTLVTCRR